MLVGRVPDPDTVLDRVRDALASDLLLPTALARLVTVERTVRFDASDAAAALTAAAESFLDRLAGGSFYVRLERRGLKGRLHSPTLERDIGTHLWRALEARGDHPRVDFADPDAVVLIETLGEEGGLAIVTRAMRHAYPFVRVP